MIYHQCTEAVIGPASQKAMVHKFTIPEAQLHFFNVFVACLLRKSPWAETHLRKNKSKSALKTHIMGIPNG